MKLTKTQIKQAVEAFNQVTVKHSMLEATMDMVLFMLDLSPNVDIVNLVGPTGIGKSLLQSRIITAIHDDYREEMANDPDFVPIIRTLAVAAGHRLFDWKTLYRGALTEVGDPFARVRKARPGQEGATVPFKHAGESKTAAELRTRLEDELRVRRTKIWIIDEAQHLVFGGRSGKPGDQFDVLKSIAQSAQVKLLLAGPHEMEPALGTSSQLARRSSTVHFRRYQSGNPEHMRIFASVANTLLAHTKVAGYPSVQESLLLLYTGSAGCVGILKDWLAKAYGCALRDASNGGSVKLTLDHLRRTRLPANAMATIMEDIRREEEGVADETTDADYARIVLGAPGADTTTGRKKRANSGASRVGTRRPVRDHVPTATNTEEEEAE